MMIKAFACIRNRQLRKRGTRGSSRKRWRTLPGVVMTLMVVLGVLYFTLVAGAARIYSTTAYTGFLAQQKVGASYTPLLTAFHYDENNKVSYCLEHTKDFPTGQSYTSYAGPAARTRTGLVAIIQNGYPFVTPSGLTKTQAQYATANAIRSWLAERGEANSYDFMILSANRVRSSGTSWNAAFNWYKTLVGYAQNARVLNPSATIIQATPWTKSGSNWVCTIRVTWSDARSYTLSVPAGVSVSGYSATNTNNTVSLSVPAASFEGKSIVCSVQLADNRSTASFHYYRPSSDTTKQRVLTVIPVSATVANASMTTVVPVTPTPPPPPPPPPPLRPEYRLLKVDADNLEARLEGAVFDIYLCQHEPGNQEELRQEIASDFSVEDSGSADATPSVSAGSQNSTATISPELSTVYASSINHTDCAFVQSVVTDAAGYAYFTGADTSSCYCMVERVAPAGYEPSSGRIAFSYEDTETIEVVVTNKKISVAVEVQKRTIDVTSAGFVSLPGEAGIDNTKQGSIELYRYDVNYRSRASSWADELVLDDPLEAVAEGKILVEELWTPIVHGDSDGHFNLWYKSNLTDDSFVYSTVRAADNDPDNPHNPVRWQRFPNTGWRLWERDIGGRERRHLYVKDLGLSPGEYVTALRLEHGRVEKGFTTKNTDEWRPVPEQNFYTPDAAHATGLEPLSYLVSCPVSLSNESTETVIYNSASAHITRDIVLSDDATDTVATKVIDSFTLEPKPFDLPDPDYQWENSEVLALEAVAEQVSPEEKRIAQILPDTGDVISFGVLLILLGLSVALCWQIVARNRREKGSSYLIE